MRDSRFNCVPLRTVQDTLAHDVRRGLTEPAKWLLCKYFYDSTGMALFEEITRLPEYYLTRVETALLTDYAADLVGLCPSPVELVELGSGSARKTRLLIDACLARQPQLTYYPIDIARPALEDSARGLLADYPALHVTGLVGEYADGLGYLAQQRGGSRLVAFLGSTVGNFAEDELHGFLTLLRRRLGPDDRFLLGFDLLKDPAVLIAAYDDDQGVTARFNLNVLARINRILGADFDLDAFRHRAVFNDWYGRIEMHLVSTRQQTVHLEALGLEVAFAEGETIHTENCYKHSEARMRALLANHRLQVRRSFVDAGEQFCVLLAA
ncbi:MAG: L-histidine N(alpha)-methyltransferase [Gemmataceae bacterium]|nr:L-histidine N(alpha)-methyltransferase [Gemmataceae bacterium]